MKRSAILLSVLALALIAAGAVYAVENSTWGEIKNTLVQDDSRLAKKVAQKKITTEFYDWQGVLTTATFLATGDGGWQEWQVKEDGRRAHFIFKPYERMMPPKEEGWYEWESHEYDQPDGAPPLPEELTDGRMWWVHKNEL